MIFLFLNLFNNLSLTFQSIQNHAFLNTFHQINDFLFIFILLFQSRQSPIIDCLISIFLQFLTLFSQMFQNLNSIFLILTTNDILIIYLISNFIDRHNLTDIQSLSITTSKSFITTIIEIINTMCFNPRIIPHMRIKVKFSLHLINKKTTIKQWPFRMTLNSCYCLLFEYRQMIMKQSVVLLFSLSS
jgi:hypothetical protein